MPTADFAAAQARLHARRQQREAAEDTRRVEQRAAHSAAVSRAPWPFQSIGNAGLSVWDSIRGREGTKPAFRVGQVDAELLDEELLELLKGQVGEALKYYGVWLPIIREKRPQETYEEWQSHLQTDYAAEILLVLRAILFKLSIWDHNASYGASLQGLRYTDARQHSLSRPPPTRTQKAIYGLVTVLGRYGWSKWESHLLSLESGYDEPSPLIRRLSQLTEALGTIHSVTALASFLTFLCNGRYRTLLDRILRLRLVPASSQTSRDVSFEYLNRQLVWHAFTEFLLFLLPLVGVARWRRILGRAWRRAALFLRRAFAAHGTRDDDDDDDEPVQKGELGFLPERTCAVCYADQNPAAAAASEADMLAAAAGGGGGVVGSAATDVTNPYEGVPCGCVYCFVCLVQRIEGEEGEGWTCLRCGEVIKECKPWSGDVVEERSRPVSLGAKSVGFEDEREASEEGDDSIKEVEPIPADDDTEAMVASEVTAVNINGLSDSAEWARASDVIDEEDSDEQSEEVDEDEEDLAEDGIE